AFPTCPHRFSHAPKREELIVVRLPPWERNAKVWGAEGHLAQRELVLIGDLETHANFVHGPLRGNEESPDPSADGLGGQEGMRVGNLVGVRAGKPRIGAQ